MSGFSRDNPGWYDLTYSQAHRWAVRSVGVLLVGDDDDWRAAVKEHLAPHGFEVIDHPRTINAVRVAGPGIDDGCTCALFEALRGHRADGAFCYRKHRDGHAHLDGVAPSPYASRRH